MHFDHTFCIFCFIMYISSMNHLILMKDIALHPSSYHNSRRITAPNQTGPPMLMIHNLNYHNRQI